MRPARVRPTAAALLALVLGGCADRPPPEEFDPRAAPLVFSSDRDGVSRVYLRRAPGAAWVPLTPRVLEAGWPVPSPDGRRILFQAVRDGALDVHVLEGGRPGAGRLTATASHDYLPAWAPDGRVTFVSRGIAPGDTLHDAWLWIMEPDGSGQRRLSDDGLGTSAAAAWAPDGSHLVVARAEGGETTLWRMDPDGRWSGAVAEGLRAPAWSPDGAWLAGHVENATGSRIDVLRADGSQRRTVLEGGWHWYPRWSPDGRWLLTCSAVDETGEDLDVLLVPVDGSAPPETLVGGPGRQCEASWMPEGPWTT